jgi:hypothetical protein
LTKCSTPCLRSRQVDSHRRYNPVKGGREKKDRKKIIELI